MGFRLASALVAFMVFGLGGGFAESAGYGYKPRDVYVEKAPRKRASRKAPLRDYDGYDYIRVESHYGPRTVIVPVRVARLGKQVKLPNGGPWVYCEVTCEYTVRQQSIDFWEGQGQGFTSPGYFRYDFYLD